MSNPTKVIIDEIEYPINTDFHVALECDKIARSEVSEYEKALAIIYKLFGDKGLDATQHHEKLLKLGQKYLLQGKEPSEEENSLDFDFEQDYDYIQASFMSDYHIDIETGMHWWTFCNLLNGLSNSELGNCCILNRVRNLRNMDTSKIKDAKERNKIEEAKRQVALKKKQEFTEKQRKNIEEFKKLIGVS